MSATKTHQMQPLVSILLPVYNVAPFLGKCLDSIINQTYKNLQIIIINDGSSDQSLQIATEYLHKYPSNIEVYSQSNQGVAETRNLLLNKIKGEYFLFVDSDDWIEPNMIEFLLNQVLSQNIDFVTCEMVKNDAPVTNIQDVFIIWDQKKAIYEFLRHVNFRGSLCNKLFKSDLLYNENNSREIKLKFSSNISYGEDALFCWHILQRVKKIMITNKKLYHYRMNTNSISHQKFGPRKFSGHHTWTIITEETQKWWPEYLWIAQARFGLEDMYLLRSASLSGYPKDQSITCLQQTVKQYIPNIKKAQLIGIKDLIYAHMISKWYYFGIIYYKLHLLLR